MTSPFSRVCKQILLASPGSQKHQEHENENILHRRNDFFFIRASFFVFNFVFFGDFDLCFLNFIYFCGHFIILGCCVKHVIAEMYLGT